DGLEGEKGAEAVAEDGEGSAEVSAERGHERRDERVEPGVRSLPQTGLAPRRLHGTELDLRRQAVRPGPEQRRAAACVGEAQESRARPRVRFRAEDPRIGERRHGGTRPSGGGATKPGPSSPPRPSGGAG